MYKTDGYNIMIPKGDSANIPFTFVFEDAPEEPFILETGQYMILSVYMDRNKPPYIVKRAGKEEQDPETGTICVWFAPEDTDITRYRYGYTIKLYNSDGSEVDTWHGVPVRATFEIA